ncbi:protein-glutamine gamma-glutamyltransferase [Paenibacillus sp. IHBB 10380]|uniref:protein-glutamine gamma-glutamyltransferase n=1 Tax=Paenibacillus sp. IHBB 10380 TaxID=1566358 RepID=UPI0005CFB8CF|nr:protein-glutamine gamma-glutamyltransferase [Paenibacillus sp. IHBB 10380]AJS59299.1 protein-glutamine gamma-glutamyltransferase [Paenibacillus sp. IHBB 10380]
MILISGYDIEQLNTLPLSDLDKYIVNQKKKSPVVYHYDSLEALEFELKMRTNIVEAAIALDASKASFATFKNSRCNNQLWTLTENGGFRLKSEVLPSDGINDIFENGHLYAFECATAMVIILYKGTLDSIHQQTFNAYFRNLYLRDWKYDSDLRLKMTHNKNEAYPGDVVYFSNPDHDPKTPEWQGENTILLGDNLYFGHGIGIRTSEEMIASLNRKRIPGSVTSAYISDIVLYPDFEYLRKLSTRGNLKVAKPYIDSVIFAKIGVHRYIKNG